MRIRIAEARIFSYIVSGVNHSPLLLFPVAHVVEFRLCVEVKPRIIPPLILCKLWFPALV